MTKLTESTIEDFAIKLFERLGYDTVHGPDIAPAPDGEKPERSRYDEILLARRLEQAIRLLATETVLKQAEMIANELAVGYSQYATTP